MLILMKMTFLMISSGLILNTQVWMLFEMWNWNVDQSIYQDGKRYFTWDDRFFPDPMQMINNIASKGRKVRMGLN